MPEHDKLPDENYMQENAEFLQTIIDAMPLPVFYKNLEGLYLGCNRAFEDLYGISREDIIGKTVLGIEPQDLADRYRSADRELMENTGIQIYEGYIQTPGGDRHEVIFHKTVFTAPDGSVGGIIGVIHDNTHRLRREVELQEGQNLKRARLNAILLPEGGVDKLELAEIIDVDAIQEMMSSFFKITGIGVGILDLKGRVLIRTGWQDICTRFHRIHQTTRGYCIESDLRLATEVEPGTFKIYKCKNNMWDMVTPITIGNTHLGNIYLGQFFFEEEMPDLDVFIKQARLYGFDEKEYLSALSKVPRWSRERVNAAMSFYAQFAALISSLSYSNIKIAQSLKARELAEESLRESERRYRLLLESNSDSIYVLDRDWRFVVVNDATVRDMNISKDTLLGAKIADVFPGIETIPFFKKFESVMKTRKSDLVTGEYSFCKDRMGYYEIIIDPVPEGIMCVSRDITDRRLAQEAREKMHSRLMEKQKMESLGRLAGGIAHDFNNMLSVILGHSELIQNAKDIPAHIRSSTAEIRQAAKRSAELTRQLLTFSKNQPADPKILDLNKAISGMLKMIRHVIGEDTDLQWLPGNSLGMVKMDPAQLNQIMMNLCVNARDAIKGVGRIDIATKSVLIEESFCLDKTNLIPGNYVILTVTDNGMGMKEDILENLFEPFFTTKEPGKGTGLGLTIVQSIVSQSNGHIELFSELGQGTEFQIYLPSYFAAETGEVERELSTVIPPGKEVILVVEDERSILEMAQRMIERLGYQVLSADLPSEALQLVTDYPGRIDLVLTDVIMPEMNGKELVEKLTGIRPDLKVVFMSGYSSDVFVDRGVVGDQIIFLQKPFSLSELAVKLRSVLGSHDG